MHPRLFQSLRVFTEVGAHLSLTEAARVLNMTKGAVSYQIKQLESQLGFAVFVRAHGGISFTARGQKLFVTASSLFEQTEKQIALLGNAGERVLTVGMTTYFASRWLTPRLMRFTSGNPDIRLRIQPTMGVVDFDAEQVDIAIQWGNGNWGGLQIDRLFPCPAFATAGKCLYQRALQDGLEHTLAESTLLHDADGSESWREWHQCAGFTYPAHHDALVIADPNVRVQAVINGQGVALNDALVTPELANGDLYQLSDTALQNYGYFLTCPQSAMQKTEARLFRQWIMEEATQPATG